MKPIRSASVALVAAVCALSLGPAVIPAHAALTTSCVGQAGKVTVPGDLVVPRSGDCELNGTTVQGNVRVARQANLVANGLTVHGTFSVARDGYADITDSSVDGTFTVTDGFGVMAYSTTFGADLASRGNVTDEGFIDVRDSSVAGSVRSSAGEVILSDTTVTQDLRTNGAYATEVHDSFIDGTVRVKGNPHPVTFCGGAIQGAATFTDNLEAVRLGVDTTPAGCTQPTYWARNLRVQNSRGPIEIDNNVVNGNVILTGNDSPAAIGGSNVVRGKIIGDYQDADLATSQADGNSAAADRPSVTQAQRKMTAISGARAGGNAHLRSNHR